MNKITKIFNITLSFILFALAIGIAYIAVPAFGNQALIVRSGSMEPNMPVGSMVVSRPAEEYAVGDVLTYRSEKNKNIYITHRVTAVEPTEVGISYKTKGDANEEEDTWIVSSTQIVGKVNYVIPYAGQFLTFVKSRGGFFTMIVIPALFVIILESWNIFKEIRKKSQEAKASSIVNGSRSYKNNSFEGFGYNTSSIISSSTKWNGLKILIPLIVIFSLAVPGTYAVLFDNEESVGNSFQASNDFEQEEVFQEVNTSESFILDTDGFDVNEYEQSSPAPTTSLIPTTLPTNSPSLSPIPTITTQPEITP